jgi:hypothetical protein
MVGLQDQRDGESDILLIASRISSIKQLNQIELVRSFFQGCRVPWRRTVKVPDQLFRLSMGMNNANGLRRGGIKVGS